jgi:hypothetical protein
MKRFALGVASLGCLVLCWLSAPLASAHVLKIDGSIGAVLHIEPDDDPTAGVPTSYQLEFTDDTHHLDLTHCNCMVTVLEAGKPIDTHPLHVTNPTTSTDSFTFKTPGAYTLRVAGTTTAPGAFQPFTLAYDVRATGNHTVGQTFPMLLWIGLGLITGLIILAAYAQNYNHS